MNNQRQLKFKVWDKRFKQFITDKNHEEDEIIFAWTPFGILVPPDYVNDIIIQQFTGLLDKNRKEIYEGDILSARQKDLRSFKVGIIEYWDDDASFVFKDIKEDKAYGLHYSVNYEAEIVGNIFENPNLLK